MLALRKIMAAVLALGIFAPALAFADTSTTTAASLVTQIQTFQTQISALQQQQQQAVAALVSYLKQGSTGDQVTILQALLAADPSIYPEGIISGYFGRLTAEALKRFQKKNGIEQVGFIGPKTLRALQAYLNQNPLAFDTSTATSTTSGKGEGEGKRLCSIIPPGHLIAPGWLKKHEGEDKPTVSECQNLPPGIKDKLENDWRHGTTTPPTGTTTPPVIDSTAPVVSSILVTNLATTTATISWTTNENATGKVYYSATSPFSLGSAATMGTTSLSTAHSFDLTGLSALTTYYYVLESKDAAGNTATVAGQSFVTTN